MFFSSIVIASVATDAITIEEVPLNGLDIKIERVRLGLRQYRVAGELGIPQTTLSLWESGRKPIPPGQIPRITAAIHQLAERDKEASRVAAA